ncbi:hypothetical protein FACS1894198_6630 [Clostridia bacterium]|nr:hypothetical protein FACS1894198_6630 [Clostridia bacterium]
MENIGDNPESILLEALLEASAEYYSVDLSQKIKRGMYESALKGKFTGGIIPFGYKVVDQKLVVDEEKAPIIRKAFEMYADGAMKKDIVNMLNLAGFKNRKGETLGRNTFQVALRNEKYIGIRRVGDTVVEDAYPAIISKETFEKVQIRLNQNKHSAAKNKTKIEYLLSGKMYCGTCGHTIIGISGTSRHGNIFYYYSCTGRKSQNGCKKVHEKKDFIEEYVVQKTMRYVLHPNHMRDIAEAVVAQYDKEFNDEKVNELERKIEKLDRDIGIYTDKYIGLPKSASQKILEKLELADAQKTDLEIDLAKLRIANRIRYTEDDIMAWLGMFCRGNVEDEAFRKRIIDVLINSVYLYNDKIVVFYNIRDGGNKQVSYTDMQNATESFIFEKTDANEKEDAKCKKMKENARENDNAKNCKNAKMQNTKPQNGVRFLHGMVTRKGIEPLIPA